MWSESTGGCGQSRGECGQSKGECGQSRGGCGQRVGEGVVREWGRVWLEKGRVVRKGVWLEKGRVRLERIVYSDTRSQLLGLRISQASRYFAHHAYIHVIHIHVAPRVGHPTQWPHPHHSHHIIMASPTHHSLSLRSVQTA